MVKDRESAMTIAPAGADAVANILWLPRPNEAHEEMDEPSTVTETFASGNAPVLLLTAVAATHTLAFGKSAGVCAIAAPS
jgi:hypothetical protein